MPNEFIAQNRAAIGQVTTIGVTGCTEGGGQEEKAATKKKKKAKGKKKK